MKGGGRNGSEENKEKSYKKEGNQKEKKIVLY